MTGELAAALCSHLFSGTTGCLWLSPNLPRQRECRASQTGHAGSQKRDVKKETLFYPESLVWAGIVQCVSEFRCWLPGLLGTHCFSSMVSVTHLRTHKSSLNRFFCCWTVKLYSAAPEYMTGHCNHWFELLGEHGGVGHPSNLKDALLRARPVERCERIYKVCICIASGWLRGLASALVTAVFFKAVNPIPKASEDLHLNFTAQLSDVMSHLIAQLFFLSP